MAPPAKKNPLDATKRELKFQGIDEESDTVSFVEHTDFGTEKDPSPRGTALVTFTRGAWIKAGAPMTVTVTAEL